MKIMQTQYTSGLTTILIAAVVAVGAVMGVLGADIYTNNNKLKIATQDSSTSSNPKLRTRNTSSVAITPTSTKQINSQDSVGIVTDNVVGYFGIDIDSSIDDISVDQSSLPITPGRFSPESNWPTNSAHNLIKVYNDGSKQTVPFSLRFCSDHTDVCSGTNEEVALDKQNYYANAKAVIKPSVKEVRIEINNELADIIERPQRPPKITRFYKEKLSKQQLKERLSQKEYQELTNKEGVLLKWKIERGSYLRPQIVLRHKTNRGWQVDKMTNLSADNSNLSKRNTEFLVTEDTISSGSGKLDFQLQVSDGFHMVTAKKDNFVSRLLNPIELKITSPSTIYLRTPFFVTIDQFNDPVSGIIPTRKRTVFYERDNGVTYPSQRRSSVLPPEYEIEWSSQTLPLEEVAQQIRKDTESPTALRVAIPKERKYTDLLGEHTVQAKVVNSETGMTQTATTTFTLVSLSEACSTEEALVKIGCPTTTVAE